MQAVLQKAACVSGHFRRRQMERPTRLPALSARVLQCVGKCEVSLEITDSRYEMEVSRQERFERLKHSRFRYVFQPAPIADVTMRREPKTPSPRFACPEQADARNSEQIRRMKHGGIDAEKQVALPERRERIRQR
jgi:hypothetical protein